MLPTRSDADLGPGAGERVLRNSGFTDVESRDFAEPRDWRLEDIVGYLRSTSVCSDQALGEDAPAFEADLRAALGGDERRVFHEALTSGYTLGRRPA